MTGSMMTEPIIGACSTPSLDPDLWQPEPPNGRPTERMMRTLAKRTNDAITICNDCPEQKRCLEFGSQPNDLPYGVWGGKLAGQRILELGYKREDLPRQSELGKALDFYDRIKPYMEESSE